MTYPGESIEFSLITRRQLTVYRSQSWLLSGELFVEIARIGTAVLQILLVDIHE
jgi:hypothetical protein